MSMCPYCDSVYDESEDIRCPYCYPMRRRSKVFLYVKGRQKANV